MDAGEQERPALRLDVYLDGHPPQVTLSAVANSDPALSQEQVAALLREAVEAYAEESAGPHVAQVAPARKLDARGLDQAGCACGWRGRIGTEADALASARAHVAGARG